MSTDPVTWLGSQLDIGKPYEGEIDPKPFVPRVCKKTPYPSEHAANEARKRALKRARNRPRDLRTYLCPDCRWWHLTRVL